MNEPAVLVVGGAGYIGSHMILELLKNRFRVVTLDNLSTGHRELLPGGVFVQGSLEDDRVLDSVFETYPIEAVMHFAAFSQVGESVANPLKYYRNNVAGTVSLLAAMARHAVRRFIFSSTAAVYGEPQTLPIAEDHPCRPTNPYGFTKLAVERLLADCETAHGLHYMSLRYFNAAGAEASATIGERHDPETHLIPLVLQVAAQRRDRITIFGTHYPTRDGTCIRDYVHVGDLARAHLLALEALFNGQPSDVFNLGYSRGFSVHEIIETARRVTGHPIPTVAANPRRGDPAVLIADSTKMREQLGWKPRYENVEDIVRSAWAWHRKEAREG